MKVLLVHALCEDVPGDTDQQQYRQVAEVVFVKHQAANMGRCKRQVFQDMWRGGAAVTWQSS